MQLKQHHCRISNSRLHNNISNYKKNKEFIIDLNHTLVINGSIISSQPCMTSLHFMLINRLVEQQKRKGVYFNYYPCSTVL